MKNVIFVISALMLVTDLFAQTIPFQYGWPRQASDDWGLYYNSPTIADLDKDGYLDISLTKSFATPELFAWKRNGAYVSGFPKSLSPGNLQNSGSIEISAAGDVDGDSYPELVFGDENGQLFVFKHNGQMVTGTPIMLGGTKETSTPALVDLDGDGILEIIITSCERDSPNDDAQLHVFKWTGTGFGNFNSNFPVSFLYGSDAGPVAGDINDDGIMEIVYIESGRQSDSTIAKMQVIDVSGKPLNGFPIEIAYTSVGSTPALYDLDKDGKLEIIIRIKPIKTEINGIYAYNYEGELLEHFPFPIESGHPFAGPAIADMDGDGNVEIAFGSVLAVDSGKVWTWKLNGDLLPQYPKKVFATWVDGAVAMADVDGDTLPDVIAPTNDGTIFAFNHLGNLCPGFPLSAENVYVVLGFETCPSVADIDGDGDVEIFAGSLNKRVYGWDTPGIISDNIWSTYKGNAQRSGGQLKGYHPTNVREDEIAANNFQVLENYPNPFNPSTNIKYQIGESGPVQLKVFDVLGNEVETLVNEYKVAGVYTIPFSTNQSSSGVYIAQLIYRDKVNSIKMILIK